MIIALLCLLGGVQGGFLSLHFVLKKQGEQILNRLVALMLFVYSVNLINTYAYLEGFQLIHQLLQPVGNYLGWFIGPSILFYVAYPELPKSWEKAIILHYSPIVPISAAGTIWPDTIPYLGVLYYLQFSSYLAVAVFKVYKNETDRQLLSWIEPLVYAMALIKIANIILLGLDIFGVWTATDSMRISLIILAALPIFMIAYREMNATKTFTPKEEKYGDSGVSSSEIGNYFEQIQEVIEQEKLYLNPRLKLEDISEKTGIHKRKISQIINESQGKNFSAFINDYRLKEVAGKLTHQDFAHLSILGIASECGFNSGGRFNTLFKKKFGVTPSEYRKKAL